MNTNNTQNTLMDSPEALGHALCNLLPEMVHHSLPAAVRRYERGIAQDGGTGPRPGLRSPDPHFG